MLLVIEVRLRILEQIVHPSFEVCEDEAKGRALGMLSSSLGSSVSSRFSPLGSPIQPVMTSRVKGRFIFRCSSRIPIEAMMEDRVGGLVLKRFPYLIELMIDYLRVGSPGCSTVRAELVLASIGRRWHRVKLFTSAYSSQHPQSVGYG